MRAAFTEYETCSFQNYVRTVAVKQTPSASNAILTTVIHVLLQDIDILQEKHINLQY